MLRFSRAAFPGILAACALAALGSQNRAEAGSIFFENFSSLTATNSGSVTTERRSGEILTSVTIPGWTLEGDPSNIFGLDSSGDKAVWLNEGGVGPNAISRTITGLTVGAETTLTFEYWGDNVTDAYSFFYSIDGITTNITSGHSGQLTGNFHTEAFTFTASAATTLLRFGETSTTEASPLFDNISVNVNAVPEPSSIAMFGIGIAALVGFARRRRGTGGR